MFDCRNSAWMKGTGSFFSLKEINGDQLSEQSERERREVTNIFVVDKEENDVNFFSMSIR
jgi:hypothetical protein